MQPLPLLFRQSLRTGAGFAKSSAHNRIPATALSLKLSPPQSPFRKFGPAICPQCQFRAQTRAYSAYGDPGKPEKDSEIGSSLENHQNRSPTHSEKSEQAPAVGDHIAPQPSHTSKHGVDESTVGARSNKAAATKDNGRRLPSHWENRRSELWKQFSQLMDNVQSNVFIANRHLNDLTGYSAIEKLKQEILAQEEQVRQTRAHVREAKDAYSAAINRRSASQREVNELLQRKHAWTPTDLERFTSLYRSDHANERAETEAQEALMAAEREAEETTALLSKNILTRYHEEQIWSDKIRRMSTWGTWGLMGVNVLLFLIFQVAVEPWRRKRLVKGFEEKVMEALEKETLVGKEHTPEQEPAGAIPSAVKTQKQHESIEPERHDETVLTAVTAAAAPSPMPDISPEETQPILAAHPEQSSEVEYESEPITEPPLTTLLPPEASLSPDSWQQTLRDLFSERRVTLSQRNLTTVALESAAAGAAVMGVLIAIFRPR